MFSTLILVSFFATGRGRLFVNLPLDYRVLLFTAAVALLTGLIFGLAPARQATRIEPNSALKESAGTSTRARSRFGKSLVVAQVALSLLLLIGAGLFVRTLYNLKTIDAGFRPEGVMTMLINLPDEAYQGERLTGLWKDVLARVERLPGVRSASLTTLSPLSRADRGVAIDVAGFSPSSDRDKVMLTNIATLNEQVDQSLMQERLIAALSLFFGLLALLLACIGLYGVMSYDVARRTNEIGIRMALGASANRVVRLVLRETLWWVALGLTLGLGAALVTMRWLESLLFGLKPHGPLTIGLAALVLLAVAALAGYLPARRATKVDPMVALRYE